MRIELQTSPSSSVLLLDNVSHLQAFEVRHCLNPHAKKKKSGILPRCCKISNIRSIRKSRYSEWQPLARIQG